MKEKRIDGEIVVAIIRKGKICQVQSHLHPTRVEELLLRMALEVTRQNEKSRNLADWKAKGKLFDANGNPLMAAKINPTEKTMNVIRNKK